MKRAATLVLVMLAMTASAAVDARALAHEGQETQWAPTRNFSSLNARAVFGGERRGATSPYGGTEWGTAAGEKDWQYAAGNPTRYTDPDGRCLPGMRLAECVTFDTALIGSYHKRSRELGMQGAVDLVAGPLKAVDAVVHCAQERNPSACAPFRFSIGMDQGDKEELAKLFAKSAGWEDFQTGLAERDPVLMGRGAASMQYEFAQFANMVAGTAAGALGNLPSAPVASPVIRAQPATAQVSPNIRRLQLTAGGTNNPSRAAFAKWRQTQGKRSGEQAIRKFLDISTTSSNSKQLAEAMAKEGRPVGTGQAAAHLVPSTATEALERWAPGARARALLKRYDVRVNDPANGVRLGEPIPHNYTHREVFLSRLEDDLENTVRRLELQGAAPETIRTRLLSRLRTIGAEVEAELAGGAPSPDAYWTKE